MLRALTEVCVVSRSECQRLAVAPLPILLRAAAPRSTTPARLTTAAIVTISPVPGAPAGSLVRPAAQVARWPPALWPRATTRSVSTSSSVARWSIAEVKVELLTPSAAQGLTWSDEVAHRSGDLVAAVMGRG